MIEARDRICGIVPKWNESIVVEKLTDRTSRRECPLVREARQLPDVALCLRHLSTSIYNLYLFVTIDRAMIEWLARRGQETESFPATEMGERASYTIFLSIMNYHGPSSSRRRKELRGEGKEEGDGERKKAFDLNAPNQS